MVEFLSSWAEKIIVAVIVATIIEMILPDNNNKKYIKLVIGIYILFVIISPFLGGEQNLDLNDIKANTIQATISEEKVNQKSMDERLQELYLEQIEKDITNKVEQEGYIVRNCEVDVELKSDAEEKGIKKIILKIDKQETRKEEDSNKTKNEIVKKVDVKIGINKYIKKNVDEENNINSEEINKLKTTLSKYYQVDTKKISITKD